MCLIAIKKPGVRIDYDVLRRAFDNNPDGAGLAWRTSQGIAYRKGFMTFRALEAFIEKNITDLEKTEVIFHFRLATAGKIEPSMTHPFCLENIKSLEGITKRGVVFHNGHIKGFESAMLSDTAIMVKDYLAPLGKLVEDPRVLRLVGLAFPDQKIVIMTPRITHIIGEFWDSVIYKGWTFSNMSYLVRRFYEEFEEIFYDKFDK